MPNMPATTSTWIRLAPATLRERKMRSGISGLRGASPRGRRSAASSASATAPKPSVRAGAPAVLGGRLDDRVDAEHQRAGDQHARPGTSAPLREARCPRSRLEQPQRQHARSTMPIGRLTKKIQCQLIAWVSTPPASRPIEPPAEATKRRRRSPSPARAARGTSSRSCRGSRPRSSRRRRPGRSARRSASPGSARAPHTSEATREHGQAGQEDAAARRSGRRAGRPAAAGRRTRSGRR